MSFRSLRVRLAAVVVLAAVPLGLLVAWFAVESQRRTFEEETAEHLRAQVSSEERALCESDPEHWPELRGLGHEQAHRRHGLRRRAARLALHAYDARFRSAHPDAPPFPVELERALATRDEATWIASGERRAWVAVRLTTTESPCAIVLLARPAPAPHLVGRVFAPAGIVAIASALLVVIAAGPLVRRIRGLIQHLETEGLEGAQPLPHREGDDELSRLARALETARSTLRERLTTIEAREQSLRRYVADTTHDVALPLSVLVSHHASLLATLEEERRAPDAARMEKAIETVKSAIEEVHYLSSLAANLDATARLEGGERTLLRHRTDLGALVERVQARLAPYARVRGVELNHAVPDAAVLVACDTTLVEQAVSNLVSNAVRYNAPGGHVAVTLELVGGGSTKTRFRIEVIDDGPGIDPADRTRALERGFRDDRVRERFPNGTGLGLAICADVVRRHGFDLDLSDANEEGGERRGLRVRIEGDLDRTQTS